ncbi:MAG: hypothetical protein EAZ16_03980 [Sphingobacteriales bacterium]|nr:MAG: hypothetical protein EAZ16_03980 [Sphingobacteriales bacterium]
MQKKNYYLIAVLFMLLVTGIQVNAQRVVKPRPGATGSWRLLGTVQAGYAADHDVIIVRGPFDYFRRLKFKVTDAPLHMHRMVVRYDDRGLPENIDLRFNIPKGGESRIIDLRGRKRKLKSVEFWYDTKGLFNGKADVTLFGIK